MRRFVKRSVFVALTLAGLALSAPAFAQEAAATPRVSVDLKDAPVRTALESLLRQAGIRDFVIENDVAGFVTMTLADREVDEALRLLARASSVPLAWSVEGGVYRFHARRASAPAPAAPTPDIAAPSVGSVGMERIGLTHIDPADLRDVLAVRLLTQGTRAGTGTRGAQPSGGGLRLFGGNGGPQGGRSGIGGGNGFGFGDSAGFQFGGGAGVGTAPGGGSRPGN